MGLVAASTPEQIRQAVERGMDAKARTIKLPIMAAAFSAVAKGKLSWDDTVDLQEDDKISGSGVLTEFSTGTRLKLRDLVNLMIVVSDNTATNLITGIADAYLDRAPVVAMCFALRSPNSCAAAGSPSCSSSTSRSWPAGRGRSRAPTRRS